MAQVWAILTMISQWWQQLLIFIGMVEKAEHDATDSKISDATGTISNPNSSEEDREKATQDLQNQVNKNV